MVNPPRLCTLYTLLEKTTVTHLRMRALARTISLYHSLAGRQVLHGLAELSTYVPSKGETDVLCHEPRMITAARSLPPSVHEHVDGCGRSASMSHILCRFDTADFSSYKRAAWHCRRSSLDDQEDIPSRPFPISAQNPTCRHRHLVFIYSVSY